MAHYYAYLRPDVLESIFRQLDGDPERLPGRVEFAENILYDVVATVMDQWDDAETLFPGRTDYRVVDFMDYIGTRYALTVSFSRLSRILEIEDVTITAASFEEEE